jgi:hypothetical protein
MPDLPVIHLQRGEAPGFTSVSSKAAGGSASLDGQSLG